MSDLAFEQVAGYILNFEPTLCAISDEIQKQAYDIRLKLGQPITICGKLGIRFLGSNGRVYRQPNDDTVICNKRDLEDVFLHICAYSVFSHETEIRNGFVSVNRAYRAGICGTAVIENGSVKTMKDISSIVFRIPREVKGCARGLFFGKTDFRRGVLIVGEPSSGKTTFLRDLIHALSSGIYTEPWRLAVLDERCEISGMTHDLGPCTDVLKGYPKNEGIQMAIRMLSPEILVCDELATSDLPAIQNAMFSGVPLIATVHASVSDVYRRPFCKELLQTGAFETIVILRGRGAPTEIEKVITVGEILENTGSNTGDNKRDLRGVDVRATPKTKREYIA